MKKILLIFLLLFVLAWGERESTDPYQYAFSARSVGMGRTGVAYVNDSLGLFTNPAAISGADKFQFGFFTFKLFDEYNYFALSSIFPTSVGKFGITYITLGVDDIPQTELITEGAETRIRETGTYSMGDRVLGITYYVPVNDRYAFFSNFNLGVNIKVASSYLDTETLTGIGVDVGTKFSIDYLPGYKFGAVVQNVVAPKFKSEETDDGSESSESAYGLNTRVGVAKDFKLWEQNFLLAADYDKNGIHIGTEYYWDKSFSFRAGLDDMKMTLGLGFKAFSFTGFDYKPYTISLDYAYHIYEEPLDNLHLFSFSVLGVTQTKTPTIESPLSGKRVSADMLLIQGTADADSDINIYVNNRLRKVAKAEPSGVWRADNVYLDQGENNIYVNAQYEQYVLSEQSNSILVYADSLMPKVKTEITREGDVVRIQAEVNKKVKAVASKMPDDKKILLVYNEEDKVWEGSWSVPEKFSDKYLYISTMAIDESGNRSEIVEDVVSTKIIEYPKDKTILTTDTVTIRGAVNPDVKEIKVGQLTTKPGEDGSFTLTVPVPKIGKNTIDLMTVNQDNKTTSSSIRILRLQSASDIDAVPWAKREITDVVTLGFLDKEQDSYYPKDYVTRGEFAKALALVRGLPLSRQLAGIKATDVDANTPFAEYIKAVLDADYLTVAGTRFRPNEFITRKDAVVAIVKMEGLDITKVSLDLPYKDVPAEVWYRAYLAAALRAGIIQSDETFQPDAELDKATAAVLLAKSKYAQRQINSLYDWKKGYGDKFMREEDNVGLDSLYVDGALITFDDANQNLKIVSPQDQEIVYEKTVNLKGLAKVKTVTVNGVAVLVNKSEVFSADIDLNLGKNYIVIQAGPDTKVLRILRLQAFKDLERTQADLNFNVIRQYYTFDDGDLNKEKSLTRVEMKTILARLQAQEPPADLAGGDQLVTWKEAIENINEYNGQNKDDKTLIKDKKDYKEDKNITRGEFLELITKTDKYRALIRSLKDYDSYQDDKFKPDKIRGRTLVMKGDAAQSDDKVALNFSDVQNSQDFTTWQIDDQDQDYSSLSRSGESIVAGGEVVFKVTAPQNNFLTTRKAVDVIGLAKKNKNVKINGQTVNVEADGRFRQLVGLNPGANRIVASNGEDAIALKGVRLLTYEDIAGLPEKKAIEYIATIGYFNEGKNFNPNIPVTRLEFAVLLARLLGEKPAQTFEAPYIDIDKNDPTAPSLQLLKDKKVLPAQGEFRPQENITQEDAYSWFTKVSRAQVGSINKTEALRRRDVARWLARDSRIIAQINRLRK